MRVLVIAPVEEGSGETITALHVGERLRARGHQVLFLAAAFARRFLDGPFPDDVWALGGDEDENHATWQRAVATFRPDAVLFADYPHLYFSTGVSPLARREGWVQELESLDALLVTLDHFGFAQRAMGMFFGPAHITTFQFEEFPAIPERMRILLPCPMHEPGPVDGRRGTPFRYWDVPLGIDEGLRKEVRRKYLRNDNELLVFHSVPNWAWRAAEALELPFYRFLPQLLGEYFRDTARPVTIVSVNNGSLLDPAASFGARIVNLAALPTADFEALLFAADLVITENKVSISMGKAICGLQPCAVLKNSRTLVELMAVAPPKAREVILAMENARLGAVYPYEVFPSGFASQLRELVLYRDNSLTRAFADLEIYQLDGTRAELQRLLIDGAARDELRANQLVYVDSLADLGDGAEILEGMLAEHRAGAPDRAR
jgi:hypothetical protein